MIRIPKELELSWSDVEKKIAEELRAYFFENRFKKAIIGLSGGLDSTVTSYLAHEALGSENVLAVLLPELYVTPSIDMEDAREVIENLRIDSIQIEISDVVNKFLEKYPPARKSRRAVINVKPRVRMTFLYEIANTLDGIVVGTSDRSELLLGYFTKYGDGGVDIEPIGDLYKTQVRKLGEHLGVPQRILLKKPSPGLLPDQTAEDELGFSYEVADLILFYKFDKGLSKKEIKRKVKVDERIVDAVLERVRKNAHKRIMPPIIKVRG